MKKSVLFMAVMLLLFALAGGNAGKVQAADDLVINEENFPAEWLRNLLKTKYYDLDGNGVLSGQEIEKIKTVQNYLSMPEEYVSVEYALGGGYAGATPGAILSGTDLSGKGALDVRGLEKLVFCNMLNLGEISCEKFTVSSCPESLTMVRLTNADINVLEVSGDMIQSVYFPSCDPMDDIGWRYNDVSHIMIRPVNHVKQLDVLQCPNLRILCCDSPTLTTVDVRQNKQLEQLSCEGNQLTELDLSNNTELRSLKCGYNQLTKLDLSNNTKLESLRCGYSQLTELDLRQNRKLNTIYAKDNQLTSLDISKLTELLQLDVRGNKLKKLDVSKNKKLQRLICTKNQLKKLDLSNNKKLQWVSCRQNKIKTLALPNINWRKYASNEEDTVEGEDYYSLFGQNPINILDLRTVSNFRKFRKETVLQFMNGKYNWREEESNYYIEKKTPLRKIKKLVISRKLSGIDRTWLKKQAKMYKVKLVYR